MFNFRQNAFLATNAVLVALGMLGSAFMTGVRTGRGGGDDDNVQVWHVIESRCWEAEEGGWDRATPYRRHIVSSEGDWYIVPEAQAALVDGLSEGDEFILPRSVRLWRRPIPGRRSVSHRLPGPEFKSGEDGYKRSTQVLRVFAIEEKR